MTRRERSTKRLVELRWLLLNIKKELPKVHQFDMGIFHGVSGSRFPNSLPRECLLKRGCGTAACALGSAALWPRFQKQGLTLEDNLPIFKDRLGIDAGVLFFGLTPSTAVSLFTPHRNHHTPRQVAAVILKILHRRGVGARGQKLARAR